MVNIFPAFINPNADGVEPPLNPYEVLSLLGYRKHQITAQVASLVRQDLWPYEVTRVTEIRTRLSELDTQIREAAGDSAITKTCKTEMNWARQIRLLNREGHELLLELARIHDVTLAYSKYASTSSINVTTQYQ